MKKSVFLAFVVLFVVVLAACSGNPTASPEKVVQAAVQAKADGDQEKFNEFVIDGNEWLWDKISSKCEGFDASDFDYEVGNMQYLGQNITTVTVFDGKLENGGFAVQQIGDQWYLSDWLGKVDCP